MILTAPPVEIDGIVNHRDLTWEKIAYALSRRARSKETCHTIRFVRARC